MLTPEQLQQRKHGIGGSDAAAILGLNRYKSPLDVYQDKLGLIEDRPQNESMYFGHLLEPLIANEYEKRCGKICEIDEVMKHHQVYPWMLANIDRKIKDEKALLECKATSSSEGWGEPGTDEIPTEYLFQCAHYAAVCDVERVDIAVLIRLSEFRVYTYHRNSNLEKRLIEREEEFWENHIMAQVPPIPSSFEDALMRWNKEEKNKSVIADEEIEKVHTSLVLTKLKISELQKQSQQLKLEIANYMKDAETLHFPNGKIMATWKSSSRKGFYVEPTTTRTLRLRGE